MTCDKEILWDLRPSQLTFIAELIGGSSDSVWVRETLIPLLSHKSRVVREGAIYGLSNHLDDELRGRLRSIASEDVSAGVMTAAHEASELPNAPLHDGSMEAKLAEALKRMTEHREFQLQMAGVTRKSEDIEQARSALAEYEARTK